MTGSGTGRCKKLPVQGPQGSPPALTMITGWLVRWLRILVRLCWRMKQIGETGVLETKLPNDASSNLKRLSSVNHPFFTKARFNLDVTVPHRQKGSALSSLRFAQGQALSEAKDLSAERDRPFASLRVTRWDGCTCARLFF